MAWTQAGSIRGPQGIQGIQGVPGIPGDKGDDGVGIEIAGSFDTYGELPTSLGAADAGKGYLVKADGKLYIWDGAAFPANGSGAEFRGPAGPGNTLSIGTVSNTTGSPTASITGTSPNQILNLTLKQGDQGIQGATGGKGDQGDTGSPGPANTLSIGSVTNTTGTPAATMTGTSPNQVLNLVLKQGADGTPGSTGPKGDPGDDGAPGARGAKWFTGSGAPTTITGSAAGDFYLDADTGQFYQLS